MKVALFGGSFDPVHIEHVRFVHAAISELGLDKVIIMPTHLAPHKQGGAYAPGEERLAMCRIAFSKEERVEVSELELASGGTSYTYLTCRALKERFPDAERFLLVGADMLENFFSWREPEDILRNVRLVTCARGKEETEPLRARFLARFGQDFLTLAFRGRDVSSTKARVALAFGKNPKVLPEGVFPYVRERGLYLRPEAEALRLETPGRRAHSYRVARLACLRAPQLGVPEEKALLAGMLHDCGKYVSLRDPLLSGFLPPDDVPEPVLHQYTGAYLAEHRFGVKDEEILDAIRYHTSGREDMTTLGKLIYLSDMLEEGRSFEGIGRLRDLFWEDLDRCLLETLAHEVEYLNTTGGPLYPLTERAYRWYLAQNS